MRDLHAAFSPRGWATWASITRGKRSCERWARRWLPQAQVEHRGTQLDDLAQQLSAYFAGTLRAFDIPLDLRGTPFQLAAWRAAAGDWLWRGAQLLGARYGDRPPRRHPRGRRGQRRQPHLDHRACHRLIGKNGALVKYGGGAQRSSAGC